MTHAGRKSSLPAARALVAGLAIGILGATVLFASLRGQGINALPSRSLCWSVRLLGQECPGCGLTRSFLALASGQWADAFALNPSGPPLFAYLAMLLLTNLLVVSWPQADRAVLGFEVAATVAILATLVDHTIRFYTQ